MSPLYVVRPSGDKSALWGMNSWALSQLQVTPDLPPFLFRLARSYSSLRASIASFRPSTRLWCDAGQSRVGSARSGNGGRTLLWPARSSRLWWADRRSWLGRAVVGLQLAVGLGVVGRGHYVLLRPRPQELPDGPREEPRGKGTNVRNVALDVRVAPKKGGWRALRGWRTIMPCQKDLLFTEQPGTPL